jgi:hypothetical protein
MRDRTVLAGVLGALASLSVLRVIDIWYTGLLLPDEVEYLYDGFRGYVYGGRLWFGLVNAWLFRTLGIHSLDQVMPLLPFYFFIWSAIPAVALYLILGRLGFGGTVRKASLFLLLLVIPYVVLGVGFLTEPMALSFAMLGIYLLLRSRNGRSAFAAAAAGTVSLGLAAYTREPYFLPFVLAPLLVGLISHRGKCVLASFAALELTVLLFTVFVVAPVTTNPGAITGIAGQPVYPPSAPEAALIWVRSLILGWGLLLPIGLAGLSVLTYTRQWNLVLISGIFLATVIGTAIFLSGQPVYSTQQTYSAIFRFSSTSLPALFLLLPYGLTITAWIKKISAALLVLNLLMIPNYAYIFNTNTSTHGLTLSATVQLPGAAVRDWILSHPGDYCISGLPYSNPWPASRNNYTPSSWVWTPGTSSIGGVEFGSCTGPAVFTYGDAAVHRA